MRMCVSMSMSVCTYSKPVCECVLSSWPWLSVGAPGEQRGGVSSEREVVMGDWSGGDGGSRFHWAFYGGLAANITTAEVFPARCLRFNTHEEETSGCCCAPSGMKKQG